jgi:hypothetical protein
MKSWIAFALVGLGVVPMATASVIDWARVPGGRSPALCAGGRFARTFDVTSFSKGNLHAHTNRSDGDSSPEDVIAWYRRSGYAFLAITDHNRFFDPRRFGWLEDSNFRLLSRWTTCNAFALTAARRLILEVVGSRRSEQRSRGGTSVMRSETGISMRPRGCP